jgi:hypothetical protein
MATKALSHAESAMIIIVDEIKRTYFFLSKNCGTMKLLMP